MNRRTRAHSTVQHIIAAREVVKREGNEKLRAIILETEEAHTKFLAKETAEGLSRAEVYDWYVNGLRNERALSGSRTVGHAKLVYVPYDRIDAARQSLDVARTYGQNMNQVSGFWNLPKRMRMQRDYFRSGAGSGMSECFVTEIMGEVPSAPLDIVYEENVKNPDDALFYWLDREAFIRGWQEFAEQHNVPAILPIKPPESD